MTPQELGRQCAQPFVLPNERGPDGEGICRGYHEMGLTKREHFAGLAMQGLLSGPDEGLAQAHIIPQVARLSVQYADALLAELAKTEAAK